MMTAAVATMMVPVIAFTPHLRTPPPPRLQLAEDSPTEIPFDVSFLRTAKFALRRALQEEGGTLSEDALACVGALAAVNPSLPNPSADDDLWADAAFSMVSNSLVTRDSGHITQKGSAFVDVDGLGGLEVSATLGLRAAEVEATASLHLTGKAAPAADTELELQCDSLTMTIDGDGATTSAEDLEALVATCATAAGMTLERKEADEGASLQWAAAADTLPVLRLGQLYLDQSCHILVRLKDGTAVDDPIVLFADRA